MGDETTVKKNADSLTKVEALELLRQMWEIRMFEDRVHDLLDRNLIKGASHLYAGEEAVAVGAVSALRDDDVITTPIAGTVTATPTGRASPKPGKPRQRWRGRRAADIGLEPSLRSPAGGRCACCTLFCNVSSGG